MREISTGDTVDISYIGSDTHNQLTIDVTWCADMKFSGIVASELYNSKEVDVFLDEDSIRIKNKGQIGNRVEILKVV